MMDLRSIAAALGGDIAGLDQVLVPGPGHSPRDRSLSVRLDPRAPGGLAVHSFCDDDWRACKDHVRERLGIPGQVAQDLPVHRGAQVAPPCEADRTARALALWHEARDPRGTPVEAYLARRGLESLYNIQDLRWHRCCPFAGGRAGAMVALVRDIRTDQAKAIHRTALALDGNKRAIDGKDRLALGPIAGGAVKLTPDADVTTALGIAEGLETALSLRLAPEFGATPVWSLLAAGGVERFPVLSGIEVLWIAVDHDPTGIRAARACAERWQAAGREVYLITPTTAGADLNDLTEARRG